MNVNTVHHRIVQKWEGHVFSNKMVWNKNTADIYTFSIYLSRLLNKNLSVLKFNLSSFTVTEIEKKKTKSQNKTRKSLYICSLSGRISSSGKKNAHWRVSTEKIWGVEPHVESIEQIKN